MSELQELREIQLKYIEILKSKGYVELKHMPNDEAHPLPKKFTSALMTTKCLLLENDVVSVEVRVVYNSEPPELPSWLAEQSKDIEFGQRSLTDGFLIRPDESIVNMHGNC